MADLFGHRRRLLHVAARDSWRDQVILQQIAVCLDIVRIERNRRIDLAAKLPGQNNQPERVRVLRLKARGFGHLTMVFRYAAIQRNGLFRQGQRCRVVAERIPNLRKQEIRQCVVRVPAQPLVDNHSGLLPVARVDQFFGVRLLRFDRKRQRHAYKWRNPHWRKPPAAAPISCQRQYPHLQLRGWRCQNGNSDVKLCRAWRAAGADRFVRR